MYTIYMKPNYKYILLILAGAAAVFFASETRQAPTNPAPSPTASLISDVSTSAPTTIAPAPTSAILQFPIADRQNRVTKKPFGIKVSPGNSPVSPEKFSGFHTGTDFETFADEQNADVEITAACNGKVLLKKWATGYGGVMVQSCKLDNADVTLIYGHLNISSINLTVGQTISVGDKIGNLGKGYSTETDGERKHLHFGIHKGTSVNILGYVQNPADLNNWLDAQKYLK